MPRPTTLEIHTVALRHNFEQIKARAQKPVMAVMKANAYGHGVEVILSALASVLSAQDMLALLEFDRADDLRQKMNWRGPILMLEGAFEYADVVQAAEQNLDLMVHQTRQIEWLETLAKQTKAAPLRIHLKLNSGMNRLGFTPAKYPAAYARVSALPIVTDVVHTTHFANADSLDQNHPPSVAEQVARFTRTTAGLAGAHSLSNSAATFYHSAIPSDWVRTGIALYGSHPAPTRGDAKALGLLAAQTLRAELIAIQTVTAGETVGYGGLFRADKDCRIGIVSCGYADGYPRQARHGTPVGVAYQGQIHRVPLVGRVSMDMLTLDLNALPDVRVGATVELWGTHIPIDEVAQYADTIGYELMCAVAPRVRRVVLS